jgi:hypothetical protein
MTYRIVEGSTRSLPDVERFLRHLNTLHRSPIPALRELFSSASELVVARAPGRLDVMGGIADYSGSLVLQLPLAEATLVALQRDDSGLLQILSLREGAGDTVAHFEFPLADLLQEDRPIGYDSSRAYFQRDPSSHWAAYVAGAFLVLMHEYDVRFSGGVRILIHSDIPEGKGVSSSAALEVAAMTAVAAAFGITIEPRDLSLLCQRVENLVVGAIIYWHSCASRRSCRAPSQFLTGSSSGESTRACATRSRVRTMDPYGWVHSWATGSWPSWPD